MSPAIIIALLAAAALAAYLAPALIAYARAVPQARSIAALNLARGWTVTGWLHALAAAAAPFPGGGSRPPAAAVNAPRPGSPPPLRLACSSRPGREDAAASTPARPS